MHVSVFIVCVPGPPLDKTGNVECCNCTDFIKPVASGPHTGSMVPPGPARETGHKLAAAVTAATGLGSCYLGDIFPSSSIMSNLIIHSI